MLGIKPASLLVCLFGVAAALHIGHAAPSNANMAESPLDQPEAPARKTRQALRRARWWFPDLKSCVSYLGPDGHTPNDGLYCDATWDGVLCWPVTEANNVVYQNCPPLRGLDTRRYAFRECGPDGQWLGRQDSPYSSTDGGWTNYTRCFSPKAYTLYKTVFES